MCICPTSASACYFEQTNAELHTVIDISDVRLSKGMKTILIWTDLHHMTP